MRYRVKNEHGEVSFGNFLELEQAWLRGLVEPTDLIQEEGADAWQRADALPLLRKAKTAHHGTPLGDQVLWTIAGVGLGVAALYLLARGLWTWALPLALILSALLSRVTYKAFRKKPNG